MQEKPKHIAQFRAGRLAPGGREWSGNFLSADTRSSVDKSTKREDSTSCNEQFDLTLIAAAPAARAAIRGAQLGSRSPREKAKWAAIAPARVSRRAMMMSRTLMRSAAAKEFGGRRPNQVAFADVRSAGQVAPKLGGSLLMKKNR